MRSNRFAGQVRLACVAAGLVVAAGAAQAAAIYSEDFNSYTGGSQNASQPGTGLALSYGGSLPSWVSGGFHSVHAVDLGAGNYAISLFADNVITQASGIQAGAAGRSYRVSFDAGASVYDLPEQATQVSDRLVVNVLREDDTVLATYMVPPSAWETGPDAQALTSYSFTYTGDGSGAVRFQIKTYNSELNGISPRFGGAIDNLSVSAVPEPGTLALALLGVAGIGGCRRRCLVKAG